MTSMIQESRGLPTTACARVFLHELGLVSVWEAPLDSKLLILTRFVRMFAYGGSSLVLVSFLSSLGIADSSIGLFMTLTVVGDVVISLVVSLVTDGIGRRRMLSLGSVLMALSGIAFATSYNYWILLAAATIGIISPSGNEIGPFRAIEESTLSHLSCSEVRANIFAWYTMTGTIGIAFGMMGCGWLESALETKDGWGPVDAYRVIFLVYGAAGFLQLCLTMLLSRRCEVNEAEHLQEDSEEAPLLSEGVLDQPRKRLIPSIPPDRQRLALTLALLFGLDAFATSLATTSWTAEYFQRAFSITAGLLGSLFFATSILSTVSILVASSLARRFGNLKTMVYTHLPSAMALMFLGVPSSAPAAIVLLVIRASSQYMDGAPRSAFLADVLLPEERTVVISIIGVVYTGASGFGPIITGALVERNLTWVAFVAAGVLKAAYDLSLFGTFRNHDVSKS